VRDKDIAAVIDELLAFAHDALPESTSAIAAGVDVAEWLRTRDHQPVRHGTNPRDLARYWIEGGLDHDIANIKP